MQKGDRIGAILSRNEDGSINLLGYGVYAGDCIPAEAVGFMADGLKAAGAVNPCMKLDNGDVVYACECWWGPEDRIRKMIAGAVVKNISINTIRESYRLEQAKKDRINE